MQEFYRKGQLSRDSILHDGIAFMQAMKETKNYYW